MDHLAVDDIGVIAPYHAQVRRLRRSLEKIAPGIQVGSVEEFQGQVIIAACSHQYVETLNLINQERTVIIMSTVRSSMEFIEFDLRHTLGFVANPRRFNGQSVYPLFYVQSGDIFLPPSCGNASEGFARHNWRSNRTFP